MMGGFGGWAEVVCLLGQGQGQGKRVKKYEKKLLFQDDCEVQNNMLASLPLRSVNLRFFHLVYFFRFFY